MTRQNIARLLFIILSIVNIYASSKLIYAMFTQGTYEAGGLYTMGLLFISIPLGAICVAIFLTLKKTAISSPTILESILFYINILSLGAAILILVIDSATGYFREIGRNKIQMRLK